MKKPKKPQKPTSRTQTFFPATMGEFREFLENSDDDMEIYNISIDYTPIISVESMEEYELALERYKQELSKYYEFKARELVE